MEMTMDNCNTYCIEPETVHIERIKKDLAPLNQRIGDVVRDSDVVMIGEGNHYDSQTKNYSEQIFRSVIATVGRQPVVFLEARSVTDKVISHFDYAVKYCEENGISYYAIDTAANASHDNGLAPERDVAMASNIEMHMQNNPGCIGIFIGGSNHCNKEGAHFRDLSELYNDGYNYENTASLLKEKLRVAAVLSHYTDHNEVLASSIDMSKELMCLPGKYANFYASKNFSDSGSVGHLRFYVTAQSFDLITFVPTIESRVCKKFGKSPDYKITYMDEEVR